MRRAIAALAAVLGAAAPARAAPCMLEPGPAHAVVEVIDGATLRLDDGREVRLAGLLAPGPLDAAADVGDWPPAGVAAAALSALARGHTVELAFAGARTDRHGRLVAQVFRRDGEGRTWLQGRMLEAGSVRAAALPGGTSCIDELRAHESAAMAAGAGVWALPAYRIRRAERTFELLRYRSTYQVVEGRVTRVSETRGQTFVNFGADWREDFTAVLNAGVRTGAAARGIDVAALAGRLVRVRGWIERRNGPSMQILDAAEIELVAGDAQDLPPTPDPAPAEARRRSARTPAAVHPAEPEAAAPAQK